jgi:arylsulfatase
LRIPAIAWWPGTIRPGVSSAVISALDILPTLAHLVADTDADARHMYTSKVRRLDGINVHEYLLGRKLDDDENALTRRRVGEGSDCVLSLVE